MNASGAPAGSGAAPAAFACVTTGYLGFEEAVRRVRNATRDSPRSREYLDWRYRQLPGRDPAEVFWLRDAAGNDVGMAAVIPRGFCLDGESRQVGVLGDIGVDPAWRGQSLGRQLCSYLTGELAARDLSRVDFVIPTEAARRTLAGAGWLAGGRLVPQVLLLDPVSKAPAWPPLLPFARVAAALYRLPLRGWLGARAAGQTVTQVTGFDARFDELWRRLPKRGLCLGDRDAAALNWRYTEHPEKRFGTLVIEAAGALRGYLVWEDAGSEAVIYDLIGLTVPEVRALLAHFALGQLRAGRASIRLALSATHPYRRIARGLGFVSRPSDAQFQLRGAVPPGAAWMITQGDKDI